MGKHSFFFKKQALLECPQFSLLLSSSAGPKHVTQTKRDFDEYIRSLLRDRCFTGDFGEGEEAASYGIRHYSPDEVDELLKRGG